jgi:restriction system protein
MSYKDLFTFKQSEEIYDLTVLFCDKYFPGRENLRIREQMVHAARSAKQCIAEGASQGTSLKGYIKMLGVSRGSLEELLEDYLDISRQRKIIILLRGDKRVEMVKRENLEGKIELLFSPSYPPSLPSRPSSLTLSYFIDLIKRTNYLLDKQIRSLEQKFVTEGGYSENLLKKRLASR